MQTMCDKSSTKKKWIEFYWFDSYSYNANIYFVYFSVPQRATRFSVRFIAVGMAWVRGAGFLRKICTQNRQLHITVLSERELMLETTRPWSANHGRSSNIYIIWFHFLHANQNDSDFLLQSCVLWIFSAHQQSQED